MFNMINKNFRVALLCSFALLSSGCASLLNTPMKNVRIESEPTNANYTITNQSGDEVAFGTTPDLVLLRTSDGIFQKSRYYVTVDSAEFKSETTKLNARVSGWYWLNLFSSVPGLLGLFVIDPFTGAMFSLPDESKVILQDLR